MKVVIVTNIIFSVLLNSEGTIGDLIFNSEGRFEFYSCANMRNEIRNHWDKLKKISNISEDQLQISYALVLSKLKFINEEIIPVKTWYPLRKSSKKLIQTMLLLLHDQNSQELRCGLETRFYTKA